MLAFAVAGLAGFVDAVGYLSANRYFVSFMSGNTTRMATDFVREPASAAIPALLILGFVLGVASGSLVGHAAGRWRKPAVLALVTALLASGAAFGLAGLPAALLAMLVLAMGALNNTLQQGDAPVALTYMTGALVRIGQALAAIARGHPHAGLGTFLALWVSLASGAALGAAAYLRIGVACLGVAVAVGAFLTVGGWLIARRA
ncbi:YoaK family protein [Novosphingobium colocasiae]|uniref:YoaK family protein n=1 Tax=Novosphingobium colocasiae TaxID=1256513 RepID=UPI0035B05AA4